MEHLRLSTSVAIFLFNIFIHIHGNEGCAAKADILFLLDGSDSISDQEFLLEKELVTQFIRSTEIGPSNIRVGIIVFSSDIANSISLSNSTGKDQILTAIDGLSQPQEGSRLDLGINHIEHMLYTEGRSDAAQIGIIVTDGRSKYPDATKGESEALRAMGIQLMTVGVGRLVEHKALKRIAAKPEYFVYIEPFPASVHQVYKIAESIGMKWCSGAISSPSVKSNATGVPPLDDNNHHQNHLNQETNPAAVKQPPDQTLPVQQIDVSKTGLSMSQISSAWDNTPNKHMKTDSPPQVIPVKSKVNPDHTQRPWWDEQYTGSHHELIQNDLGWYTSDQTAHQQQTWKPQATTQQNLWQVHKQSTTTLPPPVIVETDPPTVKPQQKEQTWDNIYRNPVRSIKFFDIQIPLGVPYISRSSSNKVKPITARPTTKKLETTEKTKTTTTVTTTKRPVPITKALPVPATTKHREDGADSDRSKQDQAMQKLCFGSQFVDGVGYNADPKSCNEFIQCFYDNGKIQVEKARCPFRMFWDQRLLLCRPSKSMHCWRDPCFDYHVQSYHHKGNCRAHWSCKNGLSTAKCCPTGFAYKDGLGCVNDSNCNDWCEDEGDLTFSAPFASCRMTPFETNEKFYFEEIPGMGMMTRSCPRGSQFNAGLCTCEISEDVRTQSCRPELALDFSAGFSDSSGNNLAVTPQNVHVENGAARFDGNGRLTIWRFSSFSFGSQLTITMKFKESSNNKYGQPEHLISNCCCMDNPGPSLDIQIQPGSQAKFITETTKDGHKFTTVPYNNTNWKSVKYIYNGRELIGDIDGVRSSVPVLGVIEERPAALVIGSCDFFGGLNGYVDDVRLYLCVPGSTA